MSRGIGKRQVLLLQALASLDAEHPEHSFPMSAIVTRLYSLSPDLQDREQQLQDRRAEWRAELEAKSDAGDANSKHLLTLMDEILFSQTKSNWLGRKRERVEPGRHGKVIPVSVEDDVNPSRCMRSLERRGLVRGGPRGWFKLSQLGRDKCKSYLSLVKPEEPMPT
jgi:hypothetical protein